MKQNYLISEPNYSLCERQQHLVFEYCYYRSFSHYIINLNFHLIVTILVDKRKQTNTQRWTNKHTKMDKHTMVDEHTCGPSVNVISWSYIDVRPPLSCINEDILIMVSVLV